MARAHLTRRLDSTEEAITVLFCLLDDAYTYLNPRAKRYEGLKRLSDSEILALALLQQLRGIESQRSFLRGAERFFSCLFPGEPSGFRMSRVASGRRLTPLRMVHGAGTTEWNIM